MNLAVRQNEQIKSKILKSKSGYAFDYYDEIWQLDGSTKLNFKRIYKQPKVSEEIIHGLRYALSRLAQEASANYTTGCYDHLLFFLRSPHYSGGKIKASELKNYRTSLDSENEYKLGYLRGFLNLWDDWNQEGLAKDVIEYLDGLTIKGNKKGAAVEHRCPYSGPYTTTEQAALLKWATNSFEDEEISLRDYAWFYASFLTGRRATNLRTLRYKDLKSSNDNGVHEFRLAVPRAKQRGAAYRSQFREILINEDLYLLLENQASSTRKAVEESIGHFISSDLRSELPIFADERRLIQLGGEADLSVILRKTPDYLHIQASATESLIRDISKKCGAISERTGDTIHVTQTRMRRSRATNLSRKGIGGTELAYLLDHSDTQQIGVYVENTPNVAERIDKAMLPVLAPLAMAARGILIESEKDALRANDPHSRIRKDGGTAMGNCGNEGFCAGGIKSCLVCTQFQPWINAPWNDLLDELFNEREGQKKANATSGVLQSYDMQIAQAYAIKTAAEEMRSSDE